MELFNSLGTRPSAVVAFSRREEYARVQVKLKDPTPDLQVASGSSPTRRLYGVAKFLPERDNLALEFRLLLLF
ncbi:hypothetical protein RRF57_001242 [Xylaria bambusicola]|uniref:Uncharacterized protein n=1 Tax=Xylaria bambusicola TaxID=326684 RepID=A0AAN7UH40_9PEZI